MRILTCVLAIALLVNAAMPFCVRAESPPKKDARDRDIGIDTDGAKWGHI